MIILDFYEVSFKDVLVEALLKSSFAIALISERAILL